MVNSTLEMINSSKEQRLYFTEKKCKRAPAESEQIRKRFSPNKRKLKQKSN